jgi:hypothetical protein
VAFGEFFRQKVVEKCGIWGFFFESVAYWEFMFQKVGVWSKSPGSVFKTLIIFSLSIFFQTENIYIGPSMGKCPG